MGKLKRRTLSYWLEVAKEKHAVPPLLLQQLVTGLEQQEFSLDEIPIILHLFGEAGALETRSLVERHLTHEDPIVRYEALNTLVLHWGLEDHRKTCIRMMHTDFDEDNRALAAGCLGSLDRATEAQDTLRVLLEVFFNGTELKYVKEAAYLAILDVMAVPREKRPPLTKNWDWDTDINWQLLNDLQKKLGRKKRDGS